MSVNHEQVVDYLSGLKVLQLGELVKELEDKWGVSAAAAAPVMMAGPAAAEAAEEQTEFDAILISFGEKKIQVIKEVRALTGLGLKEAKQLVEGAPTPIKEAASKEDCEAIKEKIEAAGGAVEIK